MQARLDRPGARLRLAHAVYNGVGGHGERDLCPLNKLTNERKNVCVRSTLQFAHVLSGSNCIKDRGFKVCYEAPHCHIRGRGHGHGHGYGHCNSNTMLVTRFRSPPVKIPAIYPFQYLVVWSLSFKLPGFYPSHDGQMSVLFSQSTVTVTRK